MYHPYSEEFLGYATTKREYYETINHFAAPDDQYEMVGDDLDVVCDELY